MNSKLQSNQQTSIILYYNMSCKIISEQHMSNSVLILWDVKFIPSFFRSILSFKHNSIVSNNHRRGKLTQLATRGRYEGEKRESGREEGGNRSHEVSLTLLFWKIRPIPSIQTWRRPPSPVTMSCTGNLPLPSRPLEAGGREKDRDSSIEEDTARNMMNDARK